MIVFVILLNSLKRTRIMNFSIKLRLLIIACFFLFSPLVIAIQCGICASGEHSDNYCPKRVQNLSSRDCIMQDITAFLTWLNPASPAVLSTVTSESDNNHSGGTSIDPQPDLSSVPGVGIVTAGINAGRTALSALLGSVARLGLSPVTFSHPVSTIPDVDQLQILDWQGLDSHNIALAHNEVTRNGQTLDRYIASVDKLWSTLDENCLANERASFERCVERRTIRIKESEQTLKEANQKFRNKLLKKAGIHHSSDTTLILEPSLGAIQLMGSVKNLFDFTSESEFENADQHSLYPVLSGLEPLLVQLIQALQVPCQEVASPIQTQVIFENNSPSMPSLESINALIQQVGNVLHQPAVTPTVTIFSPSSSLSTTSEPLTHALHNIMVFTTHQNLNTVTIVVAPQVGVVAQLNNPLVVHTFVAHYLSAVASTNQVTQWSAMTFSSSPHEPSTQCPANRKQLESDE